MARVQVLAPPLSQRLLVLNAFTGQPGWVDAARVGQVAADDGLSTVPVLNAAAENPTTDAVAEGAPAAPAPGIATYTVQPGDTLNHIAAQVDSTIAQLWAANPGIDPDRLVIGKELVVGRRRVHKEKLPPNSPARFVPALLERSGRSSPP